MADAGTRNSSRTRHSILGMSLGNLHFGPSPKDVLQKRLSAVREREANLVCCDCEEPEPAMVCLLVNPVDRDDFQLGLFCCEMCSLYFGDMGTDVCQVKSLARAAWTTDEVEVLENTGNSVVNFIYEARLDEDDKEEERHKSGFIARKYETLKFFSKRAYSETKTALERKLEPQKDCQVTEEERKKGRKKADKKESKKASDKKSTSDKKKSLSKKKSKDLEGEQGQPMDDDDASLNMDDLMMQEAYNLEETTNTVEEEEKAPRVDFARMDLARKPPTRRRRDPRKPNDPLASQSDHAPLMRRTRGGGSMINEGGTIDDLLDSGNRKGRRSRSGSGSKSVDRLEEASQGVQPAQTAPRRIQRRANSRDDKAGDPLASHSDHVSTSRRKRKEKSSPKEIVWDPTCVPVEAFHASLDINAASIKAAQKSMEKTFDRIGFEDVDFSSFQNAVAPGEFSVVPQSSTNTNQSSYSSLGNEFEAPAPLQDPGTDANKGGECEPTKENVRVPRSSRRQTVSGGKGKGKRSSVSPTRRKGENLSASSSNIPKPGSDLSLSDLVDDEKDEEPGFHRTASGTSISSATKRKKARQSRSETRPKSGSKRSSSKTHLLGPEADNDNNEAPLHRTSSSGSHGASRTKERTSRRESTSTNRKKSTRRRSLSAHRMLIDDEDRTPSPGEEAEKKTRGKPSRRPKRVTSLNCEEDEEKVVADAARAQGEAKPKRKPRRTSSLQGRKREAQEVANMHNSCSGLGGLLEIRPPFMCDGSSEDERAMNNYSSQEKERQPPGRAKSDKRERRSATHKSRRAKLHSSMQNIRFNDYLPPADNEENVTQEFNLEDESIRAENEDVAETYDQNEEDNENEGTTKRKSKLAIVTKPMSKIKQTTSGLVNNTLSTIRTMREKRAGIGTDDEPVHSDEEGSESLNLTACAG